MEYSDVTAEQWAALGSKRFFFGHQSVGADILRGVTAVIASRPAIAWRVAEVPSPGPARAPGLYHAKIGVNGQPATKIETFSSLVATVDPDVAMMKFCYVDVDGRTDPGSLFAAYAREMSTLRGARPGLRIVHVTMPLTEDGNWKERLVKAVKREPTARELNRRRNRYNERLLAEYAGKEPVFDLAAIESTHADGSRACSTRGGRPIYSLAPELTNDGGHLNAEGQRIAAERFMAIVAAL